MQHPCKFWLDATTPPRDFAAVAFLADHIHTLRAGRPIEIVPAIVTSEAFSGQALIVRYADEAAGTLGYAVIGAPEYVRARQLELLDGALYRLDPLRAVA
ncbi:hypothetical protein [Phenylobacterium sp.]|jgi:hypothetical protein|uniref:hypothetical protein n=1 Tax=Phenylobacterium sp. TaxID=1871053 RepID=UPI0037C4F504